VVAGAVLGLAGRYVARLEEELAVLVADEVYAQALFVGHDTSARQRRKLRFEEKQRPTLTRTPRLEDVPARGLLWADATTGALVASRLEMSRPRGIGPVAIETSYAPNDRMGVWLPKEMREVYGPTSPSTGDERVEAVVTYTGWRRARVEVQPIVPVP